MKKIILILCAITIVFAANAVELKNAYFVKTTGEIMNCKSIKITGENIEVVLENGDELTVAKENIKALKVNGKYFEKLIVYKNNTKTDKEEFMQFIATRAGLKLFKYNTDISNTNNLKGFNVNGYNMDCYVVYKANDFYVDVTDKNYLTLFQFFGVQYTEL